MDKNLTTSQRTEIEGYLYQTAGAMRRWLDMLNLPPKARKVAEADIAKILSNGRK